MKLTIFILIISKKPNGEKNILRIYPMLAMEKEGFLDKPGYIAQRKYDGTRCMIIKDSSGIFMMGRSWKNDYSDKFPEIMKDIFEIPLSTFILDSELSFFKGDKEVFTTALATESKIGLIAKCMVFDILEYNDTDVRNEQLHNRLELLDKLIPKNLQHIEVIKTYKSNHKQLFDKIVSDKIKGEGLVLKDLNSPYIEKSRSKYWIKVKLWQSEEAIIVGVTNGTGARMETFGSLILAQYDKNNQLKYVCKASGFKEDEQLNLIRDMIPIITSKVQVTNLPLKTIKHWVEPILVAEIKFHTKTEKGHFRFPSFLRVRTDKTPEECKI